MKTYQFKLHRTPHLRELDRLIGMCRHYYNHAIAVHKRRYGLFKNHFPEGKKHLSMYQLSRHMNKMKDHPNKKYAFWNMINSVTRTQILKKIDVGYKRFYSDQKKGINSTGTPTFKGRDSYNSFMLGVRPPNKSSKDNNNIPKGWRLNSNNSIEIDMKRDNDYSAKNGYYRKYYYFKSREVLGNIKTITIKRDKLEDYYMNIVTDYVEKIDAGFTRQAVGFDFGLKKFLTSSDLKDVESPLFFKETLKKIQKASKSLSKKKKGSGNRKRAKENLARLHRKIRNQRNDFQWKLANQIADQYDYIFFEDLNIKGMQMLWGKKINDLSFASFVEKMKQIALKKDKMVHFIDRFYPSSKTCSNCGEINEELTLETRKWDCESCNTHHDRDRNASINILMFGSNEMSVENVNKKDFQKHIRPHYQLWKQKKKIKKAS